MKITELLSGYENNTKTNDLKFELHHYLEAEYAYKVALKNLNAAKESLQHELKFWVKK